MVVLTRWRPEPAPAPLPREALGAAMRAGLRYVRLSPRMLVVLGRGLVFGLGAVVVTALMPLVARESLGGGPLTYGLLLGAFGVGAVGGALGSGALRARASTEAVVRGASGAFAAGLAVMAVSRSLPVTLLALLPAGAGWVLALSSFNVTVQMSAPRWVVARALSLYQMATFGGMAGGAWLWGRVAETTSLPTALLAAAGVLVACGLLGLALPLADAGRGNLDPLGRWTVPETAVPVDGRAGPVVVAVEWRVAPGDVPAFLGLMAERRRVRRRDGAHDWHLLHDLADPELWVERYRTATWLDYVRLNTRVTRDDATLFERLRALNRGGESPQVRRLIEHEARPPAPEAAEAARELAAPLTDPTRLS
jgi:MFS family permease